ncbi:MAG: hypothetical protein KDG55_19540 [Rhodocyclaceae bacterium]|nr:hypothetical protein [Rhodocyclaceae bacterium]
MLKRLLGCYLTASGIALHLAIVLLAGTLLVGKAEHTETYIRLRQAMLGPYDGVRVTPVQAGEAASLNPALGALPAGRWLKLHETRDFTRQEHGGAAFDSLRGRIMLFGSDTHRMDWGNTVRYFDVSALQWSQAYLSDPPETYRVNADGLPVAGAGVERPWAMHTFDAVAFDPACDCLLVASYPGHLDPGKPWGLRSDLWRQIRRHPTWRFHIAEGHWEALASKAEHFFPYSTAFDSARNELVGINPKGVFALTGAQPEWLRIAKGAPNAWHTATAYDAGQDTIVTYGTNARANDVWQYRRGDAAMRMMSTPGTRPPGGESVPLAYHPGLGRIVALVANVGANTTETWLYSTAADDWSRVTSADLPFAIGMNYNLLHDPRHDLLWLVANLPQDPVSVWALRLEP